MSSKTNEKFLRDLQALYDEALQRVVRTIVATANDGNLHEFLDPAVGSSRTVGERLTAAQQLNSQLQDRLVRLEQKAAAVGIDVEATSSISPSLEAVLHGLAELSLCSSGFQEEGSATSSGIHQLRHAGGEMEPEDMLFHFSQKRQPEAIEMSSAKKKKGRENAPLRKDASTNTMDDGVLDAIFELNTVKESLAASRVWDEAVRLASDSNSHAVFTPCTRQSLIQRAACKPLRAHWFWHSNLRSSDIIFPSVAVTCTREKGLTITCPDDNVRAASAEFLPLSEVASATIGMGAESFRAWTEWMTFLKNKQDEKLEESKKKKPFGTLVPIPELTSVAPAIRGGEPVRLPPEPLAAKPPDNSPFTPLGIDSSQFVRKSITFHLKNSRRCELFGLWHNEITFIFDSLDEYNAMLTAFLHLLPFSQYGIDPYQTVRMAVEPPPQLLTAVHDSMALSAGTEGHIKSDEGDLCKKVRVFPKDYLRAKKRLLNPFSPRFIGIDDLAAAVPTLDMFQLTLIIRFFDEKKWVALHRLFRSV